ncbi:MAG: 2Fe-2S iron-sulfur cluster-binding protein [Fimbriimonadaceae bacterium]
MTFHFEGRKIQAAQGETVLDALLRNGEPVGHGCKAGVCQACLVRVQSGPVPAKARKGLALPVAQQGGALSCCLKADEALDLQPFREEDLPRVAAKVARVRHLSPDVIEARLEAPLEVCPGQFVRVEREGIERAYSVAETTGSLHAFHIRLIPGGQMSTLWSQVQPGDTFTLQGPFGRSVYDAGQPDRPLLLIGSGTGLAPLWGVLNDALAQGHRGAISLYHGAASSAGLYYRDELEAVVGLHYVPCADEVTDPRDRPGSPLTHALQDHPDLTGYAVYLCGSPGLVHAAQKKCFLAGADMQDIFSDPYVPQGAKA